MRRREAKEPGHTAGRGMFPAGSDNKESACNAETQVQSLGWADLLKRGIATHSSILAWRSCFLPATVEWQATVHGSQRVRHD